MYITFCVANDRPANPVQEQLFQNRARSLNIFNYQVIRKFLLQWKILLQLGKLHNTNDVNVNNMLVLLIIVFSTTAGATPSWSSFSFSLKTALLSCFLSKLFSWFPLAVQILKSMHQCFPYCSVSHLGYNFIIL